MGSTAFPSSSLSRALGSRSAWACSPSSLLGTFNDPAHNAFDDSIFSDGGFQFECPASAVSPKGLPRRVQPGGTPLRQRLLKAAESGAGDAPVLGTFWSDSSRGYFTHVNSVSV